ncbi:transcriptional regulator [Enemella evansiae]|nr:transcriptional regulator [Enemella evansiae]
MFRPTPKCSWRRLDAMDTEPDVSGVAALFADRSRARILQALIDGRSLPAGRLAEAAGVSPSTISGHLARLRDAGLIAMTEHGRSRWYRIVDDRVVVVLEALLTLAPRSAPTGLTGHNRLQRLRVARTCYDHIAGALGTDLLAGLVEGEVLRRTDGNVDGSPGAGDRVSAQSANTPYELGPDAGACLAELGIDPVRLRAERRPVLRICVDWTEQRHHLGGGLGRALLDSFLDRDWVRRRAGRRDLEVREPERIGAWLGRTAVVEQA